MTETDIRSAHIKLMEVHEGIREAFSDLGEETIRDIYTPEHISEVLKTGDGYTLWAVPSSADEVMDMVANTELVLVVGKFPKLDKNSEFNPHEKLDKITSWREYIRGRKDKLAGTSPRKFSFWAWQNDCPVHGKSASNAESNKKRLLHSNPDLMQLIRDQKKTSRNLLLACQAWLHDRGRDMRVCVRWQPTKDMDWAIERLRAGHQVSE